MTFKILASIIVSFLGAFIGQNLFYDAWQIWIIGAATGIVVAGIINKG